MTYTLNMKVFSNVINCGGVFPNKEAHNDLISWNSDADSNWWLDTEICDIFSIKRLKRRKISDQKVYLYNLLIEVKLFEILHDEK